MGLAADGPQLGRPSHWALPDRPNGLFSEGHGCLTHAVGPAGAGGHMDGIHAFGPGSIGWALTEHYWLTGDTRVAQGLRAADQGQRPVDAASTAGGREHGSGRRAAMVQGLAAGAQVTPDSGGLWMQFYECEAYYWASVSRLGGHVER